MNKFVVLSTSLLLVFILGKSTAQNKYGFRDSLYSQERFFSPSLAAPGLVLGTGIAVLLINDRVQLDSITRQVLQGERRNTIDDYLIYAPLVTDIGLSIANVPSKHGVKDKAALYLLSSLFNAIMVYPVKHILGRQRPDGSDFRSFPSGHTSNAFVGAQYFWMEYHDTNILLGSVGFLSASLTGYFRIYNDKHWLSDVLCGAGIGMISTRIAYWVYPVLKKKWFNKNHLVIKPISSEAKLGLVVQF